MRDEFVRADREYRNRMLLLYLVLCLLAFAVALWGIPWAREQLKQMEPEKAVRTLEITLLVLSLGILGMTIYLFRLGRRIWQHEQFPPPGQRVLRDTRIVQGNRARARGMVLMGMSVLVGIVVILGLASLHQIFVRLLTVPA